MTDYGHIGRIETKTVRTCWPVCMCCGLRGRLNGPEVTYQMLGSCGQIIIACEECWKHSQENAIPWWNMTRHNDPRWIIEQWREAAAEFGTFARHQVVHLAVNGGGVG